ncbi:hypothetical protein KP509_14G090000 [Ceratopteris richardii]|uniref:LOB domain-containing protein n=1 Tax=Ceratopteris richardii TaxID=49495 RepID=A0A8T2TF82_CERRI|nr:hypothetical protein KP509_14G090000 [Ceratopteris richardii]
MNQETDQEGATTSSSRMGWGRRPRPRDRSGDVFDEIDPYAEVGSAEDATACEYISRCSGGGGGAALQGAPLAGGVGETSARTGAHPMSYGGTGAPCGACKFLRRKCVKDCVFAPYFGAEHGAARFAAVHKIFGASNVNKLLRSIPAHKRFDAVITISYEAQARITNPVYGCVAAIADLQQQVQSLQTELSFVHAQLANSRQLAAVSCMALQQQQQQQQGGGGNTVAPLFSFEQTQAMDPMQMQPFLSSQVSSPQQQQVLFFGRPKDEHENALQPCLPHVYDNLSMGPPTPSSLVNHTSQTPHHDLDHQQPHLTIDLREKIEEVDAPSSTATTHLHALLRTRCLNLHDSS